MANNSRSNTFEIKFQKAQEFYQRGMLEEASNIYLKLHQAFPKEILFINLLAQIYLQRNLIKEGIFWLNESLKVHPDQPLIYLNLATAFSEINLYDEALININKSIELSSDNPLAYFNQGGVYRSLDQLDNALNAYENALKINPDYADALNGIGRIYHIKKEYYQAIEYFDKAIRSQPNYAEYFYNKAMVLDELKEYTLATNNFYQALKYKPDYFWAYNDLGHTLQDLKRHDEALASYDRAIQLKPDYHEPYNGKGNALLDLKRYDEALASYDRAIQLKPDSDNYVYGSYLGTKSLMCDWDNINQGFDILLNKINNHEKVAMPFTLLSLIDDPEIHKKVAEIHIEAKYPSNNLLGQIKKHSSHQKIRLGYFSPDFKEHPVSYLTAELFEMHDQSQVELYAFSFSANNQNDAMQQRIQKAFNHFIDVSKMSDQEVALLAREYEIDIAIDLAGFTKDSRTQIFAYRAAPTQISYIGYLGTMGAPYMDYLIAEEVIIPKESKQFYSENILYLPTYQCNDTKKQISTKPFTKEELGLPQEGFIFCSFNNSYKFNASIFDSWMRILSAVKGSVLWLLADNQFAEINLKKEAMIRGADPKRLIFAKRLPRDEYLARFKVANLFLDTHPYNAGTTASDALWAGLPLVTFLGKSFASRMCGSILKSAHLSELVAESQEAYEALAIQLANNPEKLDFIKNKMKHIKETPLFDIKQFTKNLEGEYLKIHQDNQNQ